MDYKTRIISECELYRGFLGLKKYRLRHELFAGASVLLYDPQRDALVMIEQFRIGALERPEGAWVLEVVGGIIEPGEEPEQVARREALEESGCRIAQLEPICQFMVSPGFSTEQIHLYCGRVDASGAAGIHRIADEGEDIRVCLVAADAAIDDLFGGRINSTSSIIAVQWLALNRERLRREWLG